MLYRNIFLIFFINYAFIYLGDIINHPRLPCGNGCGRSYKYICDLRRHMRKECGVEPQYKCQICSKAFARKDALKAHHICVHKIVYQPIA